METTWGPDHITTVPEDYAQHVILGVRFYPFGVDLLAYDGPRCKCPVSYMCSLLFQTLRLLCLATHLESQALDLKREALESLSIGVGGTRAAAIWDVIAGAFALCSEPAICPYLDYAGPAPAEDPFDAIDLAPAVGRPLGYDVAAAPGYKPVDHIEAALHRLQVGVPPVATPDALGPLLVPDDPSNPASCAQVKAVATQQ